MKKRWATLPIKFGGRGAANVNIPDTKVARGVGGVHYGEWVGVAAGRLTLSTKSYEAHRK